MSDVDDAVRRRDLRPRAERWVRHAWERGAGPGLRAAGAAYRLGAEVRNALWDLGVLQPRRASLPVVSVGGLTVGGSGKTPLAAEIAGRWAGRERVGVVTHGYADEMALHRELNPDAVVTGGVDRVDAVEAAADAGARLAIVDGGFQHRRLWRDVDVVTLSARSAAPTRTLPAGPRREGWPSLARADAVVVVRRRAPARRAERLARWLSAVFPDAAVARCCLRPAGLRPANQAARDRGTPDPAVAVASIMYPEVFLRQLREAGRRPQVAVVLPDHAAVDRSIAEAVLDAAAGRGVVGTLKDVVKLRPALGDRVPVWRHDERLVWEEGGDALFRRIRERVAPPVRTERGGGRRGAGAQARPGGHS